MTTIRHQLKIQFVKITSSLIALTVFLASCGPEIQPGAGSISGTVSINQSALASFQKETRKIVPNWKAAHVPGQILVLQDDKIKISIQSLTNSLSAKGLDAKQIMPNAALVKTSAGNEEKLAKQISEEFGLATQPNYLYFPQSIPNDPLYSQQFNLPQIGMPEAWDIATKGATVAVLDTGIDPNHEDLVGHIILGKDFCPSDINNTEFCVSTDDDPTDDIPLARGGGHGTHVAGIISAGLNNKIGISGIMDGKTLVIKVLGYNSYIHLNATTISVSNGIRYAVDNRAKVINMSLGFPANTATDGLVDEAIDYADSNDVLMVAAAGNGIKIDGTPFNGAIMYPASNPKVLAVGSVNETNALSNFSAIGPKLFLVAPGQFGNELVSNGILSAKLGGGYHKLSGTSMAAPQVAAVAGLIRGFKPNLTVLDVRGILGSTAKDLGAPGRDNNFGFGLLQAGAALKKAQGNTPQTRDITIYAEYFKNNQFNRSYPESASINKTVQTTEAQVNFKFMTTNNGSSLNKGKYRLNACVKQDDSVEICSPNKEINYNGNDITGINLELSL